MNISFAQMDRRLKSVLQDLFMDKDFFFYIKGLILFFLKESIFCINGNRDEFRNYGNNEEEPSLSSV